MYWPVATVLMRLHLGDAAWKADTPIVGKDAVDLLRNIAPTMLRYEWRAEAPQNSVAGLASGHHHKCDFYKDIDMPAYNFQKRFAALVESGKKMQTIRKTRKRAKVGATAYLYTGQRTPHCRKLGNGVITGIFPIEIGFLSSSKPGVAGDQYALIVFMEDGKLITDLFVDGGLDDLAKLDGFANGLEMVEWFDKQYGLPFTGFLHQWVLNKKPPTKLP